MGSYDKGWSSLSKGARQAIYIKKNSPEGAKILIRNDVL
jgi:hypothetical protein